ncbi:type I restriction modification DNA specificity domain protein [Parvimonas sp. KA00067]|uniref:restriction endonuclease subunit S n=1 Tax=Parvimonas sp. KA00067 TaxID=1588755 RepID=UPI0007963178|nr:restriction endonuclease subunit S [Parvimonas sp. KA00067]KXB64599.1 type I restriction modification DNA specificity domain protein [Parvimonas sp. KA00067]
MSRLEELIQELCPEGVEYRRVDEICDISRGKVMSKDFIQANEGEYPVYSSQTENDGELGRISSYAYDGEYLTWTTDGANAGSVFYRKGKFSITNVCGLLKVNREDVLTRYIFHTLQVEAPKYVNKGMGNPKLMSNVMSGIKLPVPPLEVQREIVHILDSFTLLTAELTAELTARKKQYEYYRDKLLNNNQNVNARVGKLIDMLSQPITDGPHTTPVLVDDGIPFLSAEAVSDGKIYFDKKRGNITKEFDEECCKKYKPQRNDVFMVKSGSTTGKVGYVDTDERFNIWSPIAALRVNDNNSSRYLFHLLQSTSVQNMVKSKASHGSQPNLGMRVLEQFEVSIPPLDVQIKIAEVLDNFDAICSDLNSGLPAEIEARQKQYEYYRDKLLTFKQL